MRYKIGEAVTVDYIALKRTTGLTNLKMQVFDEAGIEFAGSPITMIEVIAGTGENDLGLYTADFTPDAVGRWRIRIESATNKDDLSKIFQIQVTKEDDIKTVVDSIEGKVDNLDLDIIDVKTVVDSTEGKVDNLDADVIAVAGQITDVKVQTQSIEDKIDAIDLQIDSGGYIL